MKRTAVLTKTVARERQKNYSKSCCQRRYTMIMCLAFGLFGAGAAYGAGADPLADAVSRGHQLFTTHTFGGSGRTCESCHHAGGQGPTVLPNGVHKPSIAGAASYFPRFNPKVGHLVTLEDQVRRCVAGGLQGKAPAYDSAEMRAMIAYLTSLSQGKAIDMGGRPK